MWHSFSWISDLKRSVRDSSRSTLVKACGVGLGAFVLIAVMIFAGAEWPRNSRVASLWVEHAHQLIGTVDNVRENIDDIETGERGFLLTDDMVFLERYQSGIANLSGDIHALTALAADNPEQMGNVSVLENLLQSKLAIVDHIIEKARAGDHDMAIAIMRDGSGKAAMDKVRQTVARIIAAEHILLDQRIEWRLASQDRVTGLLIGLLSITVSFIGLGAVWAIQTLLNTTRRLRDVQTTIDRDQRLAMMDIAAITCSDADGVIRFWSEGCREIYGWTAEQMVGRSIWDRTGTGSPAERRDCDAALLCEGTWSGDRRGCNSDGVEIIVAVHKVARRDANGCIFAVVETLTDVTQLRELEARLKASQIQFRSVVDAAADAIFVAHPDGKIMTANRAALCMFGYERSDDLIGRDLDVLMPAIEAAQHGTYIANYRAGASACTIGVPGRTLLAVRRDGSDFPIDLSVSSFEIDGQLYLTGIVRDITQRRQAEIAMYATEVQLRLMQKIGGIAYYDRLLAEPFGMISEEFVQLYGLPPEQGHISTTEAIAFLHPEDRERIVATRDRLLTGGPSFSLEGRIIRTDGSVRWLSMHTELLPGPDGRPYRIVSAQRDITEIVAAREALLDRQQQLEKNVQDGRLALDKSEEHSRLALMAVNSIGTYDWDIVNDRVYGNGSFARIFGIGLDRAAAGTPLAEYLINVPADARAKMLLEYERAMQTGGDCSVIHPVNQADGSVCWCLAKSHCSLAADGRPLRMRGVLINITDQRIVEDQLRQSQKMEAVGQLTGGLAHDFNNMLQGITGSLELLKARIAAGRLGNVDRYITAAQGDAARAATLTQRLLAFSRRQVLDPVPTNLDKLVAGMADMIRRTVGPSIKIVEVPTDGLWTTLCDFNQLENALLNLCINARDAMPNGGLLTIETCNIRLDKQGAFEWDMMPGEYVTMSVTDTGIGMPPSVVAQAFDPFFTTKPLGMGTGLGLSMIYGFAQQSGGQARIYSEVGVGTTVRIYLPQHRAAAEDNLLPDAVAMTPRAEVGQTILVVDDEATVRMLITDILQEQGYLTIEAVDGASGLKVLQSDVRVDLLISDVGLPGGMNGRQMADAARISRPDLKVLFITGYASSAVFGSGRLEVGMQVLTKPFALDELTARTRGMINEVEAV